MLTESITIPLEGEQALVFQGIEAEEQALAAKRNAMVTVILAGKGYLAAVRSTPTATLAVTAAGGIVVSVPPKPDIGPTDG